MKEINFSELRKRLGKWEHAHGYELSENEKYFVRYTEDYFQYNTMQLLTIQAFGGIFHPDSYRVVKDFNHFGVEFKKKSQEEQQAFLRDRWGKQFLWDNEYTRGIVVRLTESDDVNDFTYHVLVECSRLCTGFKYAKIIISDAYSGKSANDLLEGLSTNG